MSIVPALLLSMAALQAVAGGGMQLGDASLVHARGSAALGLLSGEGMRLDLRLKVEFLRALFRIRMGSADIERPLLYAVYGGEIIKQLKQMDAHPHRDDPDRALVVVLKGSRPAYVRCVFADHGSSVRCECRAGVHGNNAAEPGSGFLAEIAAGLETAGYRQDADGRYVFPYELDEHADDGVWGGVAVAILNPLIDVFGATSRSNIDILAPKST